jgi:type IV pilus assembly protein PilN
MIRINLLPVRQTRKFEAARLELVLALAGGVFVVLLGAAGWAFAELQLTSIRSDSAALQAEIDRLAEDVKRVDEMEKFKAELERKLAVIDDLRAKKDGPVHMLDEIGLAAPEKLWLTKMEEQGGQIRMAGVSVSNDVISQFLRALDASPYFEQVYLEDIEALPPEKNLSVTLKSFRLTAHLVAPKPEDLVPGAPGGTAPAGAATPAPAVPVPADAAPAPGAPATPDAAPATPPPATPPPASPAPASPAPATPQPTVAPPGAPGAAAPAAPAPGGGP